MMQHNSIDVLTTFVFFYLITVQNGKASDHFSEDLDRLEKDLKISLNINHGYSLHTVDVAEGNISSLQFTVIEVVCVADPPPLEAWQMYKPF